MIEIPHNSELKKPRQKSSWPSSSFQSSEESVLKLSVNTFPLTLHPDNLRYNHNLSQTSALKKKENDLPKKISAKMSFLKQVQIYFANSSLHGLKYVGDPNITFGERIIWFISFTLAIVFATYYISDIYTKWKSNPVIISFSPFDADLSSIPFPAVTICNMNQAKRSKAEIILKNGSLIDKRLLDESCNGNSTFNNTDNLDFETLRNFLIRVGSPCSDILKWCQWGTDLVKCEDIFQDELTDQGLCCSFNRLPPTMIYRNWKDLNFLNQTYPTNVYDWNAEKGYDDADTHNTIPRRPLGAGAHLGLSVILDTKVDDYYCSSTRSTGFKAILSNPIETPKMADFGFLVSAGFETRIAIDPAIREATSSLRSIPIEKRQCYFVNERPLRYYRSYTQSNCLLECQSTYTVELCGCVPYYLPRNRTLEVCGKKQKECVAKAKQDMEMVTRNSTSCQCLPACFFVQYPYGKSMSILYKVVPKELHNITSNYLKASYM